MKLNLMKLFDGYVRNYHTFNLTIHHGKHSFTMTEIEYFSKLGSMLGYSPFTEDTCNGINRAMDLTWWDNGDETGWTDFILHLERENYFGKDEETLDKLFCDREVIPEHVIGIMNVRSTDRIQELLIQATELCKIKDALLIFKTNSTGKNQLYFDEVHAYHLQYNKKVKVKKKVAYVSDIAGTLFMHYENEKKAISR
ncbi:hypothetical protein [Paenisporosarcina sp.]|uniref:hypothetical protein n=1 Tax=Paenisporosarcina sp. TaxID=1932001 RepID=UPI003C7714A6